MSNPYKILWVDDDPTQVITKIQYLEDNGYHVTTATSVGECKEKLAQQKYDLVIADIMIPNPGDIDPNRTKGGLTTGLELARWIKKNYPRIRIVGCSVGDDELVSGWFQTHGTGYWRKGDLRPTQSFLDKVKSALGYKSLRPRPFIVHGHNETLTFQLKDYLQNILKLGDPIILREQPSFGRAIIEKLEEEAQEVELVFVILTPDDRIYDTKAPIDPVRRARQNVIFELGYFYGKLGRKSGRIILLYKGILDIPSDLSGIIYINVDNGIESSGEEIRRELRPWLASFNIKL